jgi:hypothetical protein
MEQREADRLEADTYDHDVAADRADNSDTGTLAEWIERDARATKQLATTLDQLTAAAIAVKMQRDSLADTLRDLAMGATILMDSGVWSGAALSYIQEVRRVAEAGLREAQV